MMVLVAVMVAVSPREHGRLRSIDAERWKGAGGRKRHRRVAEKIPAVGRVDTPRTKTEGGGTEGGGKEGVEGDGVKSIKCPRCDCIEDL